MRRNWILTLIYPIMPKFGHMTSRQMAKYWKYLKNEFISEFLTVKLLWMQVFWVSKPNESGEIEFRYVVLYLKYTCQDQFHQKSDCSRKRPSTFFVALRMDNFTVSYRDTWYRTQKNSENWDWMKKVFLHLLLAHS